MSFTECLFLTLLNSVACLALPKVLSVIGLKLSKPQNQLAINLK